MGCGLTDVVEKAIRESGLGLNPQAKQCHVTVPNLNEERRKEMVRVARYANPPGGDRACHGAIEAAQSEKEGGVSEDERHGLKMMFRN